MKDYTKLEILKFILKLIKIFKNFKIYLIMNKKFRIVLKSELKNF